MSCITYEPSPGLFKHNLSWGMGPSGSWNFDKDPNSDSTNPFKYLLKKNENLIKEVDIYTSAADFVGRIFFPVNQPHFLAVIYPKIGNTHYEIKIIDLESYEEYEVSNPQWEVDSNDLHFQHSPDGMAFLVSLGEGNNTFSAHQIYRTDVGSLFDECSLLMAEGSEIIEAEITSDRKVRLQPAGRQPIICNLPSGVCKIPICDFEDVIMDGPLERSSSKEIYIENSGDACLEIKNILPVHLHPFRVEVDMDGNFIPIYISPDGKEPITLGFTPSEEGEFQEELSVSLEGADMERSVDKIVCKGIARKSLAECEVKANGEFAEVIFGVNETSTNTYRIKNIGKDHLRIDEIIDSAQFSAHLPENGRLLAEGQYLDVEVTFRPTDPSTEPIEEELAVICTPPNGDCIIHASANARYPELKLSCDTPLSIPSPTYRYRRNSVELNLTNEGEVPLTIQVQKKSAVSAEFNNPSDDLIIDSGITAQKTIRVWAIELGNFSLMLNIKGTYLVEEIGETLETNCEVIISGNAIYMEKDRLESNNSFESATPVDLPLPHLVNGAQLGFDGLTLDDEDGVDQDYFKFSFQTFDDRCFSKSTVDLSMGIISETWPSGLAISVGTDTEDGVELSFSHTLKIYMSDVYNRASVEVVTDGDFTCTCPSNKFIDKQLYAVLSNPTYLEQGPFAYDISFSYQPTQFILRSVGGISTTEIQLLRYYFERIWLPDPPHNEKGEIVNVEDWSNGATVVITNVKDFVHKHLAFISQPSNLAILQQLRNESSRAILATEQYGLAQIAHFSGHFSMADKLYRQSSCKFARLKKWDMRVKVLENLIRLYIDKGLKSKSIRLIFVKWLKKRAQRKYLRQKNSLP